MKNENYGCYISSALSTNLKNSKLLSWQKFEMGNKIFFKASNIKDQMGNKQNEPEMMKDVNGAKKHIFVLGALGAGKSTAMSVLFNPTKAATE